MFNGAGTLAVFIASHSDIDDLIPMLTAYPDRVEQVSPAAAAGGLAGDGRELTWTELRWRSSGPGAGRPRPAAPASGAADCCRTCGACRPRPRSSRCGCWPAGSTTTGARPWPGTRHVEAAAAPTVELRERPVYFVSSNTHSLINLLSGFALRHRRDAARLRQSRQRTPTCRPSGATSKARHVPSSAENFLYYVMKKFAQTPEGRALADAARRPMRPASGPAAHPQRAGRL